MEMKRMLIVVEGRVVRVIPEVFVCITMIAQAEYAKKECV